ncbi:hypothetical protein Bhyg_09014 [Pseudolycoriella hygida]|uniref:YqaJ viral recombinase domain-containing protein n=1 Tax=Pseudolycoriella hygida TaxID=35572 RepID=A0A9Q0N5Q6_9DIPT|nr:hypothetical protein Bhyg_09014 [Pseudolycoriella hygida]
MAEIFKNYQRMVKRPTEPGFQKFDGYNGPKINYPMILDFMARNSDGRPKNCEKEYLDDEIDFVQIKSTTVFIKLMCLIQEKGQSFTDKRISVGAVVDRKKKEFTSVVCNTCEGCLCDHSIAFLFWLYRRSNEPNSDRPAYWGCNPPQELTSMPIKQLYHLTKQHENCDDIESCSDDVLMEETEDSSQVFLEKFLDNLEENGQTNLPIYRMHRQVDQPFQDLFLYDVMSNAEKFEITKYKHLLLYLQNVFKSDVIDAIQTETNRHYKSRLWFDLQYGRIRCSILNEVANWKTVDDVNEEMILGTYRMPRGGDYVKRKLWKRSIIDEISKFYKTNIQHCGLLLDLAFPFFCATPDGLSSELVVEIKMPSTQEEYEKYLINNEKIPPKYFAQIQMQMFVASREKALYCVVAPDFAKTGAVEYINVSLNKCFIEQLFAKAEDVWNKLIFPIIRRQGARSS